MEMRVEYRLAMMKKWADEVRNLLTQYPHTRDIFSEQIRKFDTTCEIYWEA